VWDNAALEAKVKEGAREDIRLAKAVPVIWVYLTGWSNDDGPANFRDDVYSVDTVGEAQASVQPLRATAR
jgi:murein L,D-transpeptidase YcbB/YkuD